MVRQVYEKLKGDGIDVRYGIIFRAKAELR
jgi:hypothetical protein